MRDHSTYLRDILAAIADVESFIEGMTFADFQKDEKTASAVVRKIEVIGEAAKHVPDDIQSQHPEMPWREMARMRDRLIHGYASVDYRVVWDTARIFLPLLKEQVKRML